MKTLAIALLILTAFSATTSAQTVEIPLRQTLLHPDGRTPRPVYSMPVSIGSTLVETGVDTGSIGLRVLPNVLAPQDAQVGEQPETYSYESGVKLDGFVGTAKIGFGERAAEGRLQLVRVVGCSPDKPNCPATRVGGLEHYGLEGQGIPDAGFKAIAGLRFARPGPGAPANPFVEIGVRRYLIDLPRKDADVGRIVLDPSAEETQGFIDLPNAEDIFGTDAPPNTVPGCLVNLKDQKAICGSLLLDTGAPGISASAPGAENDDWPVDTPGRIIFGDGHGKMLASVDFIAGPSQFAHVHIGGAARQQSRATISLGVAPYLAFSVLYDVTRHGIALRPRQEAPGAPIGRAP